MTLLTEQIHRSDSSTKDMIIGILAEKYPLSVLSINRILKKRYNKSLTYQAIYKELNILIGKGIISKSDKKYMLSKTWLFHASHFFEKTYMKYNDRVKYSVEEIIRIKNEGESVVLNFNSYYEMEEFFIELLTVFNLYFPQTESVLMHYRSNWWPIVFGKKQYEVLSKIDSKIYSLCCPTTKLDLWACNFEKKLGMRIREVDDITPFWNFFLFGPYVVNCSTEQKIYKKLKSFLSQNQDIENFPLAELLKILNNKGEFKLIFMKNSAIRDELLNEIKNYF